MEPIVWLIILAVLLVIEMITLGLTTIWFAGGALAAFIASMLGSNLVVEFAVFLVVSLALLYCVRPRVAKKFNSHREKTNYESLIGKEARITETVDNFNQAGTAVVNGQEWTARAAYDELIQVGTKVFIVKVSGVKLIVTEKKEEI